MNSAGGENPYDEISYPSYTHTNSHPDRMAAQAMMWGLTPAPVTACRVMELGCGDGSNLIPMAYGLPGSRFVGVDLSATAVARGREMIRDLALTHVELLHADIMNADASWGTFDYVIAHGVFSWVPQHVRNQIFAICREHLAPHGVAFVSYLAYPGAHVRAILRDMMLFRAGETADPRSILAAGREIAEFIANATPDGNVALEALKSEAARIMKEPPNYLIHDDLAEWSAPYYFSQFAGMAEANGLQYLAEADPAEMVDFHLPPEIREELAQLAPDRVVREQYVDFLRGRRFRQTLLCRAGNHVSERDALLRIPDMWVASPAKGPTDTVDLSPSNEVTYLSPRGPKLETPMPAAKAAMALLVQSWPHRTRFREVVSAVSLRLAEAGLPVPDTEAVEQGLAQLFHHLNSAGMVEFHTDPTPQVTSISERPEASAVARWQAAHGSFVSTLRHVGLTFTDPIALRLIQLLDGTRTQNEIISEMQASQTSGTEGETLTGDDVMKRLRRIAFEGILIG